MPVRPEFRHLYRGRAWREIRERILARAERRCERCKVPDRTDVVRAGGYWGPEVIGPWRSPDGTCGAQIDDDAYARIRRVKIVITIAHLDQDPHNNAEANLVALCQWCHLRHDRRQHVENASETRKTRKDAARPLLRLAYCEPAPQVCNGTGQVDH